MKFGIALPYNAADHITQWAKQAEEAGWDGLFLGDAVWCQDPMVMLAAAAASTSHIQLGTMIVPAPLRKPWKIASEAISLDHLSAGRFILGLGAGATWMGWHGFPDEETDTPKRIKMLDETVEILQLLFRGKPFDYAGAQYHLELTKLNEMFYPPRPVRTPSIPIWMPAIWPYKNSLRRALKCDGVILEKRDAEGEPASLTPDDIAEIKTFVAQNRQPAAPFEIVVNQKFDSLEGPLSRWEEAGVTWLVEELYGASPDDAALRIQQGPPGLN